MTYEEFVKAIEQRPEGMSPLRFVATMKSAPPEASEWLLRYVRERRAA